jgi:hypothetical protein
LGRVSIVVMREEICSIVNGTAEIAGNERFLRDRVRSDRSPKGTERATAMIGFYMSKERRASLLSGHCTRVANLSEVRFTAESVNRTDKNSTHTMQDHIFHQKKYCSPRTGVSSLSEAQHFPPAPVMD